MASIQYLIFRRAEVSLSALIGQLITGKTTDFELFESPEQLELEKDGYRWIIFSLIIQKLLVLSSKHLSLFGSLFEYVLNLISQNGGFIGLIRNIIKADLVKPNKESASFRSLISHLDDRVELYNEPLYDALPKMDNQPSRKCRVKKKTKTANFGSRELVNLSILASKVVYENKAYIEEIVTHRWKMHFVEFLDCRNEFLEVNTTQAFICSDSVKKARLIVVAFRGTEPFDAYDWATDIDFFLFSMGSMGKVHHGFMSALGLPKPEGDTLDWPKQYKGNQGKPLAYYSIREKLRNLLAKNKDAKFIVTGHSLGGALAILFISVLILHDETHLLSKLLGVFTFGQPRVGDRVFGEIMDSHLNKNSKRYFRMVYGYDIVPRLPFDNRSFKFKHFGVCIYYHNWYRGEIMQEEPDVNYFSIRHLPSIYFKGWLDWFRGLLAWRREGREFKESLVSIYLRLIVLFIPGFPGIAPHSPRDYLNSAKLAR